MTCAPSNFVPQITHNNLIPSNHEMTVFQTMASQAVSSKMYRGIGDEAGVMMIMLAAREMGIPPVQALNGGINIIQGKVEIAARMMSALIRKAGHSLQVVESSDSVCTIKGTRADNRDSLTISYTLAEAQKAGLVKSGGGWAKNPKDMCFARAISRLGRQLFSDVIGIGYVEGEIKPVECGEQLSDIPVKSEAQYVHEYLDLFDKEDKSLALDYLKVFQKHFGWTTEQAIKEIMKDVDKLFTAFGVWKSKIKRVDEQQS